MEFSMVNGTEILTMPPTDYDVDFSNPQKNMTIINTAYCVCVIGFVVSFFTSGYCLYAAYRNRRKWHFKNHITLPACIPTAVSQALILACLDQGVLGVHARDMSLDDAIWKTKLMLAASLLVIFGNTLSKLALCFLYHNLKPSLWYRCVVYGTGVLILAAFIAVSFFLLFACQPIQATWDPRLSAEAQCIDRRYIYMLQASVGALTDLILVVTLIIVTLRLQMAWEKKAIYIASFSSIIVTLGIAVARLFILVTGLRNSDTSFVLDLGTLHLIFETNLSIIAVPGFRIAVSHIMSKVFGSRPLPIDGSITHAQGLSFQQGNSHTIGDTSVYRRDSGAGVPSCDGSAVELLDRP